MVSGYSGYLRLPLLCAVTTLLLQAGHCSEEFRVCEIPCCDCSKPLELTCECPDLDSISLSEGDIPESVQSIDIKSGARQFTIHENAFYDLSSLVTLLVDLRYNGSLKIEDGGLALRGETRLYSLTIENVKTVTITTSAFSGTWDYPSKIKIRSIEKLDIQHNGLNFESPRTKGPSLNMEQIRRLELAPNAIKAPVNYLVMTSVSMPSCHSESFSGHIADMELSHVNITRMNEGCVKGSGILTKLSMRSCNLGTVHSEGISGKIQDVRIYDTNITTVQENGFLLQVNSLHITDSRFRNFMSSGLNVKAANTIRLNKLQVEYLRKHALINLQVVNGATGHLQSMYIRSLTVLQADNGSLAFAKGVHPSLSRLEVRVPDPPVCPTEKWTRWLVGKGEYDQLARVEQQILQQLHRSWLCPENDNTVLVNDINRHPKEIDKPMTSHGAGKGDLAKEHDDAEASHKAAVFGTHQGPTKSSTPGGSTDTVTSSEVREDTASSLDENTVIYREPSAVSTSSNSGDYILVAVLIVTVLVAIAAALIWCWKDQTNGLTNPSHRRHVSRGSENDTSPNVNHSSERIPLAVADGGFVAPKMRRRQPRSKTAGQRESKTAGQRQSLKTADQHSAAKTAV